MEITSPEGYEVWYTLDCTDPRSSETAREVKGNVKVPVTRKCEEGVITFHIVAPDPAQVTVKNLSFLK